MGKKNANNAIDFARIFAVKDKLAQQEDPRDSGIVLALAASVANNESPPRAEVVTSARTIEEQEGEAQTPQIPQQPVKGLLGETFLRIGMSRELHERVRAFAALRGQPSTTMVRELFERVTPTFDLKTAMPTLAVLAREAVPMVRRERRVDVRMQIPVTEHLHRRMQQFAALRTQTLGASMLDVLEAHAPSL